MFHPFDQICQSPLLSWPQKEEIQNQKSEMGGFITMLFFSLRSLSALREIY